MQTSKESEKDMCDKKQTTDQHTEDNEDHEVTLDVLVLMPGRYEEEADRHGWWNYWRLMVDSLRRGGFDSSLFEDMALFAIDELIEHAGEESLPKRSTHLVAVMREFADAPLDEFSGRVAEYIRAAQLLTEAICMQAVTRWVPVDGEISDKKIVVLDQDNNEVTIDLYDPDDMLMPLLPADWSLD